MRWTACILFLLTLTTPASMAQDCSIISKANDIIPDRLCSPVTVNWEVSYRGVNDGGTSVQISFDWDDGSTEIVNAINTDPDPAVREWSVTLSHTYTSIDDVCNYEPIATLVVNGVECSSSSQEQIVTVWDNDDNNGGELLIDPPVYPICIGNSANVQFTDNTQFNCVPPQENDVPNVSTRWIQWIYGTDITMTGSPVTIDGNPQAFPYAGSIITLPGPVTGSGVLSQVMNVANDKLVGQFFEITLRYWNYCNPWDDPVIPGPPADPVNGDHPPVTTTAIILIVDNPDATIDPVAPVCEDASSFSLSAADGGGIWSGPGIIDPGGGIFDPGTAGPGNHTITYSITDGNGCFDSDTEIITVHPSPDASITAENPFCIYNSPVDLESASPDGTWTGSGIINSVTGIFDPSLAGDGDHMIYFLTDPDLNGCRGRDSILLDVNLAPLARIATPDSSWCSTGDNSSQALVIIDGNDDNHYDITWEVNGLETNLTNISNDSILLNLDNLNENNTYRLLNVTEHFGAVSCESDLNDTLINNIFDTPLLSLDVNPLGICSPVQTIFTASEGFSLYKWSFGDGETFRSDTSSILHSFYYFGKSDTTYYTKLVAETTSGCKDSINSEIPVYPSPLADFFVSPARQDYPDTIVSLSNLSRQGNWSYYWDFGDGSGSEVRQPVEHAYTAYGAFNITLRVFSEYCADTISKEIIILPPTPTAYFEPDTFGCPPVIVNFMNTSKYGDSFIWDFDDGTFSTERNPTHSFYQPKIHNVKLKVIGLNGEASFTQVVDVYPYPQALFVAYPTEAKDTEQVFKFVNNSVNANRYFWDFGDGNTSEDFEPDHVYGKEGIFDITLYAWSEKECTDTLAIDRYITVNADEGVLSYPNVFRWNQSGPTGGYWTEGTIDNTVFHPHFFNVVEYKLLIYSRWGELVYESDDLYKGWDGYHTNGKKATQGVYVYKALVTYISGRKEVVVGDVTFLH